MINAKMLGIVLAAFIAGAFVASPELRAYAAATIGSAEIIDGSIQSIDIGTGQVKAVDIAGSAVTSGKIKDGTIAAIDLAPGVGTGDITGVAVGSGLVGGGTSGNVVITLTSCPNVGDVLEWNGGGWQCAAGP